MRYYLYCVLFVVFFGPLKAQWLWEVGGSLGVSNYLGDIGGNEQTRRDFVSDVKLAKTRWNVGGFARYKVLPRISVKVALDYLRIEGDDKLSSNPARHVRNLNFRNDMMDLGITGEFFFFENNDLGGSYRFTNGFRAYVFGGVGLFYSNPKAYYQGDWVALRPLHTEGVSYSPLGVNLPVGLGFYFTINKQHRIGYEVNWRTTFTDYLDDISGNYPTNPNTLSPLGRALSLRAPELGPSSANGDMGVYKSHDWGQKRGDKSNNDAYVTMTISYSYVFRGTSTFYRSRYSNFFGGRNKHKARRIRAKF